MKTTNTILLVAFVVLIVAIISLMVYLRASISFDVVEGSGNVIRKEVETRDFQNLVLRGRLHAYLSADTTDRIIIEADDNLVDLVVREYSNGTLTVYLDQPISKGSVMNIYVHAMDLNSLHLSAGSVAHTEKPLTGKNFEHILQAGAKSTLHLHYEKMDLKAHAGAVTNLEGMVDTFRVVSAAGAVVDAHGLRVNICDIEAKAGSVNNLYVTGALHGSASHGAVIHYGGNPPDIQIDTNRGGHIESRSR